ncbi:MAG: TetR/AcrR family transcriptional regulator [Gammaproteobacteria bacterium]
MTEPADLAARIVDQAIALAESGTWESVRLFDVAAGLGVTLDEVRVHFREKEALVEAWFDRADRALLQAAARPDFLALDTRQRLHSAIMCWLDALAAHRRVTRQMILGKLEPGHLHVQIPVVLRVSRTVQWIREAAQRDTATVRRTFEEIGTTSIYLATFGYWMSDDSPGSRDTRQFLDRLLGLAERTAHTIFGPASRRAARSPPAPVRTPPS